MLIIDAHEYLKYISPVEEELTGNSKANLEASIKEFEEKYHKGELPPFYASEPLI